MSNVLRNRARRGPRISTKERAAELEQALAASDAALGEMQDDIDLALQHFYDAGDILEALLPAEEDPAAEERERVLREKLDGLCLTAETLDEVMDAIAALPAMKWPEGPIADKLPQWMLDALHRGIIADATVCEIVDAIAAELSQKGDENQDPQPVENADTAEA